ncbi:MAG: GatB/YqeY domain-containing protein [Gammaproteobacteria bacterium]
MSALKNQINDDVKLAMRNKDKAKLSALRLITAAIKQIEVDERVEMDDTRVLSILDKMVKQRRDSIAQYEKAARQDLVEQEQFELDLIQTYLPQPLSEAEIAELISGAIADTGAQSAKDMGKVMGQLKPALQGRADMGQVSGLVRAKLG